MGHWYERIPACLPAEKCPFSSPPRLAGVHGVLATGKGAPNMFLKPNCVRVSMGETRQGCLYFTYGLAKVAGEEENKHRSVVYIGDEGLSAWPPGVSSCRTPCTPACVPQGWQRDGCVGRAGSRSLWGLRLQPQPLCRPPF